jgi:hypothetical protein
MKPKEKTSKIHKAGLSSRQQECLAIFVILLILTIYFNQMSIDGRSPIGADVIQSIGGTHQINEFSKKADETVFLLFKYVFLFLFFLFCLIVGIVVIFNFSG